MAGVPDTRAWKLRFELRDLLFEREFDSVVSALGWLTSEFASEVDSDPESEAMVELIYQRDEPSWAGPGSLYCLLAGRVVYEVMDGWAGGGANYKLRMVPFSPNGFWVHEGEGVLIFASEDL
jgi:hypothetical protein